MNDRSDGDSGLTSKRLVKLENGWPWLERFAKPRCGTRPLLICSIDTARPLQGHFDGIGIVTSRSETQPTP
jgi:hypothetical protein